MATVEHLDCSLSASPEKPSSTASPPGRSRRSLHQALGGGAAADVFLWRRRSAAAIAVVGATAFWFLFERAGYSILSLIASTLLLFVTILFFWAKAASLLNRPLPPLPNLEISDEVVGKAAVEGRVWMNRVLSVAHDIAIGRDRKVFLQVTLVFWIVSYIGSLFNLVTLVYIGFLVILTIPALYDKYQDHVDEKLGVVCSFTLNLYDSYLSKTAKQSTKDKKTQ